MSSPQNERSRKEAAVRTAHTLQGTKFSFPKTIDMFHALLSPYRWGAAELFTLSLIIVQLLTIPLRSYLPLSYYVCVFAFWRLSYNLGIGILLHFQSHHQVITKWISSQSPSAIILLNWATTKSLGPDYRWRHMPPEFNSWIVFRALATIILANDGLSYFVLFIACVIPLRESSISTLLVCIPISASLLILSTWSKAAAHKVLGDYAWFWGDFFFSLDDNLTFSGVFQLFPHPMYTVGYAAYYGAALYARSYTLFAVSLLAHILQLVFLVLVEEPHIQRIYGPSPVVKEVETFSSQPINYENDSESKITEQHSDISDTKKEINHESDVFSSRVPCPVVMTIAVSVLISAAFVTIMAINHYVALLLLLLCRAVHWLGCSVALKKESANAKNYWMTYCLAKGYSKQLAYTYWQYMYLVSYITNHFLFCLAAFMYPSNIHSSNLNPSISKIFSHWLGGASLIAISMISLISGWTKLGAYGFFYGDCFTTPKTLLLSNEGPFRYFTHPEAVLGYLSYYGLAVIRGSHGLLFVAAISQACHIAFIDRIEKKNMNSYRKQVWEMTPLESEIRHILQVLHLEQLLKWITSGFVSSWTQLKDSHGDRLKQRIIEKRDHIRTDFKRRVTTVRDQCNSKAMELKKGTESVTGAVNSDRVLQTLRNRGINVDDLS